MPKARKRKSTPLVVQKKILQKIYQSPSLSEPGKSNDKPVIWKEDGQEYETRRLLKPVSHIINDLCPNHTPNPKNLIMNKTVN